MKKVGILIGVLVVILSACATWRLERALSSDVAKWYDQHRHIMQYRVPDRIAKKQTEMDYFLHLTPALQRFYIKQFWGIRFPNAEEDFKTRIKLANAAFRNEGQDGWRTDRGILLLMCGQPDYIDFFTSDGQVCFENNADWETDEIQQIWRYWLGAGLTQLIEFRFIWSYRDKVWRLDKVYSLDQLQFIQYQQSLMAPTEDGWDRWLEAIK